ncbi:MAG: hypothetical protein Q7K45_05420 [Nanoarchaeota archaeon]|nr:hypothetical protein [Nanoarchaeota archaeon]
MVILIGLLVLSVLVVSCTQGGTLAGEAIKTQDVRQCPNGCDVIKNLNRAVVIGSPYTDSEATHSCNDVCTFAGKTCVYAELGISRSLADLTYSDGTAVEPITEWVMGECNYSIPNELRCRCY